MSSLLGNVAIATDSTEIARRPLEAAGLSAAVCRRLHGRSAVFRGVREPKVTTNCYHWPFLREARRGKCLILNWLPPRDSNPDMLIQSQLSCR